MEDADGGLSFDFEGGLDAAAPTNPAASISDANASAAASSAPISASAYGNSGGGGAGGAGDAPMGPGNKRSFRQTVCRHWLRSLCMKGDACGFLHQYDKSRMPVCRFFRMYGECREQDCVYKHTNEDVKECNMYKLGFCPNGPDCRYRHAKLPGPPPPVEEVLQKIQHLNSYNFGSSNRSYQQRGNNYSQQGAQPPQGSSHVNQGVMSKPPVTDSNVQQQTQNEQASQGQVQNPPSNSQNLSKIATPLPQGITRYFIVKSSNRENLELSVQQGVWATQRTNEAKLNEAFDTVEHVILIFSVNRTRNFQGCAKMTSKIGESTVGGNWKHAHGTAHYGRNFSVKWLKLCELSFQKTRHLRNPYNENLPVKISRDCQELEPLIGEQLASLLYLEPDSDLMATLLAAETKREEEKAKGVNLENGAENPDIVLFDDNEEEEDDESEEEDDSFAAVPPLAAQGRGRGRGAMWPPNMPMGRGARPLPGMRGFPPGMMGGDGYPYGPGLGPDGFPMPDPFAMGPRPFVPFGPRYSNDFGGPGPGMMFPPRLSQPGPVFPGGGFGIMMGPGPGPGRGHMMGGMGMGPAAGNRPMGIPPAFSSHSGNRPVKRDPRAAAGEWNSNQYGVPGPGPGPEQGQDEDSRQHNHHHQSSRGDDKFGTGNSFRNEDSESEDEAPRRSRHKQR